MRLKKVITFLLFLMFPIIVSAKTYDVEVITDESEINNSTKDNYIIVNHADNGKYYAWVNEGLKGENPNQTQSVNNAIEVKFNDTYNELTIDEDKDILWTFGLSANSIQKSFESVVLVSRNNIFANNKNQIVFSETSGETKSPTGFNYRSNAYPLNFDFLDQEGNVLISQQDLSNNREHWIAFSSTNKRFRTTQGTTYASKEVKIYRVKEKYKKVEGYVIPDKEVIFSKDKIEDSTFKDSGIYQIDLTLQTNKIKRNTDVLMILDISNSMDYEEKMEKLKKSANYLVDTILDINPNNRIGIVKFADGNAFESESVALGLSNDLIKIKELIAKDSTSKLGGTNYTDAFLLAHEILESNSVKGRDQLVIFVTDGAPTIYNKTKFSVFKNTEDGQVGAYANNWTNYFLNNELGSVEKMKEAGVEFMTVGVDVNKDMAIKSDGSFVVKAASAQKLLQNIASSEKDFYQVNDYDDLQETFAKIKEILQNRLISDSVTDNIENGYKLLITPYANKIPYIEIKSENGTIIEKITFSKDGKKAYSSLNPKENIILETEQGMVLGASTFNYDFNTKTISWNAENIGEDKITFTYFIIPDTENPNTSDLPFIGLITIALISLVAVFYVNKKISWLR